MSGALSRRQRVRNWDGSRYWEPEAIHRPRSEEEISALIRDAIGRKRPVKPVGSALSSSDIIDYYRDQYDPARFAGRLLQRCGLA